MRVHHLDCATMCPVGGRLYDGCSHGVFGRLVSHCLLLETSRGLVLVDTGIGLRDTLDPYPRLSRLYVDLLNVQLDPERTAVRQLRRLGFDPRDVRHVVLTHLDFDHAGGLEDFPQAAVHVLRRELDAARDRTARALERAGARLVLQPEAGIFLWADFGRDTNVIAAEASEQGVLCAPGSLFSPTQLPSTLMRVSAASCLNPAAMRFLAESLR